MFSKISPSRMHREQTSGIDSGNVLVCNIIADGKSAFHVPVESFNTDLPEIKTHN